MSVVFYPETHRYESVDLFNKIKWKSASKISGMFKKAFDPIKTAEKCSGNKKSKWYGLTPEEILQYWQMENLRSTTLGTWYHEKEEAKLNGLETIWRYNKELPIIRSDWKDGVKHAPNQKLTDGVYPELLVYLESAGICGQFDDPTIVDGYVHIDDHKSNKDLKKPAFVNWEGMKEMMLPPLSHMENTKLNEYSLQLSIGMYIILRHNPRLKPGTLTLNHVTFEIEGYNRFEYPIMKLDEKGEPILKGVEKIEVPYRKSEVEVIIKWLKETNV
jgi:hypothetical protein